MEKNSYDGRVYEFVDDKSLPCVIFQKQRKTAAKVKFLRSCRT